MDVTNQTRYLRGQRLSAKDFLIRFTSVSGDRRRRTKPPDGRATTNRYRRPASVLGTGGLLGLAAEDFPDGRC